MEGNKYENLTTQIKSKKNKINALNAQSKELRSSISEGLAGKSGRERIANQEKRMEMIRETSWELKKTRNNLRMLQKNKTRKNLLNSGVLDYTIVEETDKRTFTTEVMEKIAEGYVLQGGVSFNKGFACQALVKNR